MDSIPLMTRYKAQLKIPAKTIACIDALVASKSNWDNPGKNKTLPIFALKAPCDRILQVNCQLDETLEYPYLETILLDESGTRLMTCISQSFERTLEIETEPQPSSHGLYVQIYTVAISPGHGRDTYLRNTDKTQWSVLLKTTKNLRQKQSVMAPKTKKKPKSCTTYKQPTKTSNKVPKTPVSVAIVLPKNIMQDIDAWLSTGESDSGTIVIVKRDNGDEIRLIKTTFGAQRVIGLELKQQNGYTTKTQFNCVCPCYSIQGKGDMFCLHIEQDSHRKKPTVRIPASWVIIDTERSEAS